MFVSEKPQVHIATGVSLIAATAYYRFPSNFVRRSRNLDRTVIGLNLILLVVSSIKTVFAWGRNYGRNELKNFYESKLLELTTQHKTTELRKTTLETDNQALTAEQDTYKSTIAVLQERDKQRSTESARLRRNIRQATAESTSFPVSSQQPGTVATSETTKKPESASHDEAAISPKL